MPEQIKCENCNGEGLVGQGPVPAQRQGRVERCPICGGTGKIPPEQTGPSASLNPPSSPTPDTNEGGEKKEGEDVDPDANSESDGSVPQGVNTDVDGTEPVA
jgi:hypothetical protein